MLRLKEDLKNGIYKKAYLLYGEEAYLKKMYKKRLLDALTSAGDTMNVSFYHGKDINVKELIDLAETMPFFAERRVIVVEDSGFFKQASQELADYLGSMPDTTCFIFIEDQVDKRGKLYKAVKSLEGVAEFTTQRDDVLSRWILQLLKKEGKRISREGLMTFMTYTGSSMDTIENELEKLICYKGDQSDISEDDVKAICCGQVVNQIFKMVECIAKKEKKRALELYYDLLSLKEPSMRILFLINRQFQLLMQVKDMMGRGLDTRAMARKAGLQEFIVRKYMDQSRHFSMDQLIECVENGIKTDADIKGGRLSDNIAVEMLIVECSS